MADIVEDRQTIEYVDTDRYRETEGQEVEISGWTDRWQIQWEIDKLAQMDTDAERECREGRRGDRE